MNSTPTLKVHETVNNGCIQLQPEQSDGPYKCNNTVGRDYSRKKPSVSDKITGTNTSCHVIIEKKTYFYKQGRAHTGFPEHLDTF